MKCEHCGAEISFEDKFCKSCGMPNSFAAKHIADMEQYEKEYEETKEKVEKRTGGVLRGVIRALAIVIIIILIGVAGNMDEIRYDFKKSQKIKETKIHKAEYDKKFKEYLANEQYVEMYHYINNDNLLVYNGGLYDEYGMFYQCLSDYENIIDYTGELYDNVHREKNNTFTSFNYKETIKNNKNHVASNIASFFQNKKHYIDRTKTKYCEVPKEYQDIEIAALDTMTEHIIDAAMGIYGITEEDAYSMEDMTSARIEVLFEEAKFNGEY